MDDKQFDDNVRGLFAKAREPAPLSDQFAEAVVRRLQAEPVRVAKAASFGWRRWPSAVAASVMLMGSAFGGRLLLARASDGALVASARTSESLGSRVSIVAEIGAELAWSLPVFAPGSIDQKKGAVFYRVEPGTELSVKTPRGTVQVHGTCFSVTVSEGEQMQWKSMAAGALLGAGSSGAVFVHLYEGSVAVRTDKQELRLQPGERAVLDSAQAIVVKEGASSPGKTAEETALERLYVAEARVRELEQRLVPTGASHALVQTVQQSVEQAGPGRKGKPSRESLEEVAAHPSQAELEQMANECEIRIDAPGLVFSREARELGDEASRQYGLTESERPVLNEVFATAQKQLNDELRTMYVAVTADSEGAHSMAPRALLDELSDKIDSTTEANVRRLIAAERAGRLPMRSWDAVHNPQERALRWRADVGERVERMLAEKLGAARAREIRDANGGWLGSRSRMGGCK